jgi:hypothetical protein
MCSSYTQTQGRKNSRYMKILATHNVDTYGINFPISSILIRPYLDKINYFCEVSGGFRSESHQVPKINFMIV